MRYPKLKFKIDYKKDIKTFFNFVNEAHFDGGRNLEWAVFKKYSYFRQYKKGDKLKIDEAVAEKFIKSIYLESQPVMTKSMPIYKEKWLLVEEDFYCLVGGLFRGHRWPNGKYIVYPTIWGMFPRFLEDKTFQVPFKYKNKKYIPVIIAHEMLHFMFYDYFYKKYPKYKSDKHNFFVWHVSEIFNTLVQSLPDWLRVFKIKSMSYPEHDKIVNKLSKKFCEQINWSTDDLIKEIIEAVKKNKLA